MNFCLSGIENQLIFVRNLTGTARNCIYEYILVRSAFWSEAIDKLGLLRPGQSILMY